MNRKSLIVVLREIFAFTFGILILITITNMYTTVITPQITQFSYNEQLLGVVEQVNSLIVKVDEQVRQGTNTTFVIKGELPSMIGRSQYRLFISGGQLCGRTTGNIIVNRCINYTTRMMLAGTYVSGTNIELTGSNNPSSGAVINFRNYI